VCYRVGNTSFNPRAREGRDADLAGIDRRLQVSIHAPVKDATLAHLHRPHRLAVSIHAPVKDATVARALMRYKKEFQSTRP